MFETITDCTKCGNIFSFAGKLQISVPNFKHVWQLALHFPPGRLVNVPFLEKKACHSLTLTRIVELGNSTSLLSLLFVPNKETFMALFR